MTQKNPKSNYFSKLLTSFKIRSFGKISLLATLVLVLLVLNISLGSVHIPIAEVVQSVLGRAESAIFHDIVWAFRLPKAITCIIAGAALAMGGLVMQTLFRNALAGPDVLGLSSGASLLVAITVMTGLSAGQPMAGAWTTALAASVGSSLVFLMVISIAFVIRDNTSLLIIGLMISAATQSLVSMLQFVSRAEDLQTFVIWTMGTVGSTNWNEIGVMSLLLFAGIILTLGSLRQLNAWLLGENYAQSLGINLGRSRLIFVLAVSLITGGVTAFCGPIAFVGLAVPHLIRLFMKTSNHKILLPATMLGGASLLLFCDILAQLPGSTQILPLNAITSLMGAPVVIWMILRNKKVHV